MSTVWKWTRLYPSSRYQGSSPVMPSCVMRYVLAAQNRTSEQKKMPRHSARDGHPVPVLVHLGVLLPDMGTSFASPSGTLAMDRAIRAMRSAVERAVLRSILPSFAGCETPSYQDMCKVELGLISLP